MKRVMVTELFTFNELDVNARKKVVYDFGQQVEFPFSSDYEKTLDAFCNLFNLRVTNWSFNGYGRSNYRLTVLDENTNSMKTVLRISKYIWNNYSSSILKGEYYSISKWVDSKYVCKSRYSKVILSSDCPLTGYCADYDILGPIYDIFKRNPKCYITYKELMEECLDKFFRAWADDIDYYYSEESISENFESNEYLFDCYGNHVTASPSDIQLYA